MFSFFSRIQALCTRGLRLCATGSATTPRMTGVLGDGLIKKIFLHFFVAELPGSHLAIFAERSVSHRGTGSSTEHPRWQSHFAHAKCHRRNFGVTAEPQCFDVVDRVVRHRGNLDDIRIEFAHPVMDVLEVVGSFVEIVVADDSLRVAVSRNSICDIHFEVNIVSSVGDRGTQEHLPIPSRSASICRRLRGGDKSR